jgi:coenzyme Q-binding protein COQ10
VKSSVNLTLSGFTAAQLFRVAGDIEAYPNFLPYCVATRILTRDDDRMTVDNVFRWGAARVRFISQAEFQPTEAINIRSTDGPFKELKISWRFKEVAAETCQVSLALTWHLRVAALSSLAELFDRAMTQRTINAFIDEVKRRSS